MGGFFNLDGPFYKFGTMLADIIIVSLLWFVFSLPIVTIGASTSAAYYVMTRRVSNREQYIFRDFWKSFKRNLKTGTLLNLTLLAVAGLLWFNVQNIEITGKASAFILPFQYCFLIEILFVTIHVYPQLARFEMGYKALLKSSFFMANRHLPTSLALGVMLLAIIFLAGYVPVFVFAAPGVYFWLSSILLIKIFKKYRPEIDKEPDYEELHQKLLAERAAEREAGANGDLAEDDRVFDDAAGLLIEKQAGEANKKKGTKK